MFNRNDVKVPINELRITLAEAPNVIVIVKIYNRLIKHSSSRDIAFLISVDEENVFVPILVLTMQVGNISRKPEVGSRLEKVSGFSTFFALFQKRKFSAIPVI